jgi:hypothetical protein
MELLSKAVPVAITLEIRVSTGDLEKKREKWKMRWRNLERAMGIEQIRMNQTKALPPVPQFNWSQMESSCAKSPD